MSYSRSHRIGGSSLASSQSDRCYVIVNEIQIMAIMKSVFFTDAITVIGVNPSSETLT